MKFRLLLICFTVFFTGQILAQNKLKPYEEYIDRYAGIALDKQKRHGIPASITLAQGLLESGAGKSEMAVTSNNHFGIKCHNNWKGETVTYFDDGVNSCFRKYKRVDDSYEDHSLFLTSGARYRNLFQLDINDYKGWANGLQKAGYATDRAYADKLIRIIETYKLDEITRKGSYKRVSVEEEKPAKAKKTRAKRTYKLKDAKERIDTTSASPLITEDLIKKARDYHGMDIYSCTSINALSTHVIQYIGTTPYVVSAFGDSYTSIAEEFGVSKRSIIKNNDFDQDHILTPGEIVYLDRKTTWWEGENPTHIVKSGDTMFSISQKYALQLKALYKLNEMKPTDTIKPGQRIKLRNPEQMSEFVKAMNESLIKADTTNINK